MKLLTWKAIKLIIATLCPILITAVLSNKAVKTYIFLKYIKLEESGWLIIVLLILTALLLLGLLALEVISFLKDWHTEHRFIQKRFGILWKYERIVGSTDLEPIPYCPKHKVRLVTLYSSQDIYHWTCEECKDINLVLPRENKRVMTTSEAVSRMRKWFNRI